MKQFFSLTSYLNFLSRNKLFTVINIFGFSVSLVFVVLFGLYIQQQMLVDSWHTKGDRIYRLVSDRVATLSAPIAQDLTARYPEIESVIRVGSGGGLAVTNKADDISLIASATIIDSNFFAVFDFKFVAGDPLTALNVPTNVLISRSFSSKIFPGGDAMGKNLELSGKTFIVSGIFEDFENTCIGPCDLLYSFQALPIITGWKYILTHSIGSCNYTFFVLERENADLSAKLTDMADHFKSYFWIFKDGLAKEMQMIQLRDVYFTDSIYSPGLRVNNINFLYSLATMALLILLFAMINYINLSVAQSGFRAKEAATRRLLGGTKLQLFSNFIIESVLLCLLSIVIACFVASLLEPVFSNMMDCKISVRSSFTLQNIGIALGGVVILGFISGLFPAFVLSKFQPIEVVRGSFKRKTKMVYSKVLISFQYMITIVLIGCTIMITNQTRYMKHVDMGFERDNILQMDNTMGSKIWGLKSVLMGISGVKNVSFTQGTMIDGGNNNTMNRDGENHSFQTFVGDSAFMDMMNMEVIRLTGSAADSGCYLNETAWRKLGLKDDATEFKYYDTPVAIKGVLKDFHFRNMATEIGEAIIFPMVEGKPGMNGDSPWSVVVQLTGDDQIETYEKIKSAYMDYNGGVPCESFFWNDAVNEWYAAQERMSDIVSILSLIAIVISSLGMLAMSMYFIRQRTKEIALRKVFGSTDIEVLKRLMRSFLILVVVAFVVAVPIIWYLMDLWLSDFVYRINITLDVFIVSGLVALVISSLTVLWQSVQAMRMNPAHNLKD